MSNPMHFSLSKYFQGDQLYQHTSVFIKDSMTKSCKFVFLTFSLGISILKKMFALKIKVKLLTLQLSSKFKLHVNIEKKILSFFSIFSHFFK